jgi:uncharacterized protein (TIGR02246 family)
MLIHRNLGVVTVCVLAWSACRHQAAPLTDQDRNAIRTGVANLDKAMLAADWPAAGSVYTEDGLVMPPNGPAAQGRAAIQKLFSGFPKVTAFHQSVEEIEGHGDLAYARVRYEVTMMPPGSKAPVKDQGKVLAVWRKQPDGSWLVSRAVWNSDLAGLGNLRPGT